MLCNQHTRLNAKHDTFQERCLMELKKQLAPFRKTTCKYHDPGKEALIGASLM